jgi:hypothetical protein
MSRPLFEAFTKPTDEQKIQWGKESMVRRAEFSGYVFELKSSGKVYVLIRASSAPVKPGQVGFLRLVGVIDEPEMALRLKINDKAEPYSYNDQTHY